MPTDEFEIDPPNYDEPLKLPESTDSAIRDMARKMNVSPRVVLGQILREGGAWAREVWVPRTLVLMAQRREDLRRAARAPIGPLNIGVGRRVGHA